MTVVISITCVSLFILYLLCTPLSIIISCVQLFNVPGVNTHMYFYLPRPHPLYVMYATRL